MRTVKWLLLLIPLLGVLLASCQETKTYRIGVSQCSSDDWRNKCNDEILREIMLHRDATVEIRSADDSSEKQIADLQYFVDQHFDAIIVAPNEAEAITPIIQKIHAQGIPVIVFDRNIHGDTYTAYQGVDNVELGRSAAHYARHLIGKEGEVIEIHGLAGSTPAIGRHEGFVEEAARNGLKLIATVYGDWNYEEAAVICDSIFRVHKEVDLIYAHNDRMAIAAADMAKRFGIAVQVIGIDAAPEIGLKAVAEGKIEATFLYPTEGYRLIRTALAILKKEPYERDVILPNTSVVNLSNADILLLQNEFLKEETRKVQLLKSQVDDFLTRHETQTYLFYLVVVILLLLSGVFFLLLNAYWERKRYQKELLTQNELLEQQRDKQKALNEQLNQATQSKLTFFTNVSHDLRTPLTLIAEPVEQLAEANNLTVKQQTLLSIATKNIRILKRLINQILDFQKYEHSKLDLHLREIALAPLIKEWAEAFQSLARQRSMKLSVELAMDDSYTLALDPEKIERIFFNLLSNAFKYTPQNGKIFLRCSGDDQTLTLTVEDNGQGIAKADLDHIFDRFYQVDRVHPQGSGIGLSLVKAFVELHDGTIRAESEEGAYSRFIVNLPVRHVQEKGTQNGELPLLTSTEVERELSQIEQKPTALRPDDPLLLVIDDNEDIRALVALLMREEYNVIGAADGKEGVRLAAKYVPDLIICDMMMPVMDGLECCRRIKQELSTSHIPVLMLTACSLDEQRAQGYESGADGYLAKPFDHAVLKARCHNLIENRQRIKQLWTQHTLTGLPNMETTAPKPATTGDVENVFYARFLEIVQAEMGNPELSVDLLAARMGLGRSQFYRKIKALTNCSPVELLRNLRLKRARDLLLTTDKSVSEIAYEVGFSAPAYFTRCYREAYNETPTDLREKTGS